MTENNSALFLCNLIFAKGSLPLLKAAGLLGIYVDDHGAKKKYKNCIFFHFNFDLNNEVRNTTTGPKLVHKFLSSVLDFTWFFDFYETDIGIMLVFRCPEVFISDIENFKRNRLNELSSKFKQIVLSENFNLSGKKVYLPEEIYRFDSKL